MIRQLRFTYSAALSSVLWAGNTITSIIYALAILVSTAEHASSSSLLLLCNRPRDCRWRAVERLQPHRNCLPNC